MKIYVVGSSKNNFLPLDNIREKFLIDQPHEGDNIDFLNPWYCELTGFYYLWKHCNDEIIGLEHYRRFFLNNNLKLLDENRIIEILKNSDVICAKEHYPNGNGNYIYTWPQYHGLYIYFETFLNVIEKIYGPDMKKHFSDFLYGNWHIQGNLIITKRKILENYLNWFLTTCIEYNKMIPLDINKKRINAYLSEFLLGAWLTWNKYNLYFNKYQNVNAIID